MTATIRLARPGDQPAIRDCAEAAYGPYVPLIGRRPAPMDEDFQAQIAESIIHVAVERADILGYITFFPEGGAMLLESVAVFPKHAGKGVGKVLIGHCEFAARAAGLPRVRLYTNAVMTGNIALYQRLGYIETGRRVEEGFHRVFFEKPVSPSAN